MVSWKFAAWLQTITTSKDFFNKPIKIAKTRNVNKCIDSHFELILKSLKNHIASLKGQFKDKDYIQEELLRKSS